MDFIGVGEYRVPNTDWVPLLPKQHAAGAVSDNHSVLVLMLVESGLSARRNGEVADDEVCSSLCHPQQHLFGNAGRCISTVVG